VSRYQLVNRITNTRVLLKGQDLTFLSDTLKVMTTDSSRVSFGFGGTDTTVRCFKVILWSSLCNLILGYVSEGDRSTVTSIG
jgi:hypothetical protein